MRVDATMQKSESLKVCHIITGLQAGGAEGALYRLCKAQRTFDTTVVSLLDDGVYGDKLRELGVEVITMNSRSLPSFVRGLIKLRGIVKEKQPDIIQTWMYHADLVGGVIAWGCRIPVCWGIRTSTVRGRTFMTWLVAKLCVLISGVVPRRAISCAKRAVEAHQAFGYRAPFEVVPNGLDASRWNPGGAVNVRRQDLGIPGNTFVLAHAARADRLKDHATLAIAFSAAHASKNDLRLLLCGAGLEPGSEYFGSLPFTLSARNAVIALGSREDLPNLWRLADGFVLSSVVEGFPNVVVEAMASGLPCVVTDAGDAAEIVGDTGFIVTPAAPDALAEAILRLSTLEPDARKAMGAAARRRVEENYTMERMSEGFTRVWREMIAESHG